MPTDILGQVCNQQGEFPFVDGPGLQKQGKALLNQSISHWFDQQRIFRYAIGLDDLITDSKHCPVLFAVHMHLKALPVKSDSLQVQETWIIGQIQESQGTYITIGAKHLAWNYINVRNLAGSGVDILAQMVKTGVYPSWAQKDNLPQPYKIP